MCSLQNILIRICFQESSWAAAEQVSGRVSTAAWFFPSKIPGWQSVLCTKPLLHPRSWCPAAMRRGKSGTSWQLRVGGSRAESAWIRQAENWQIPSPRAHSAVTSWAADGFPARSAGISCTCVREGHENQLLGNSCFSSEPNLVVWSCP